MAETFPDKIKKMKNGAYYVSIPTKVMKFAGWHIGDAVKVMVTKAREDE